MLKMQRQQFRWAPQARMIFLAWLRLVPLVSADFLQAAHAAPTHQWRLQDAVPGLEVRDHMMMSRRGVDLLFQVAVLQELGLEKQEVLAEMEEEH